VIREIARQGLLPYPRVFASTKPFGTPLAPVSLMGALTFSVVVALPAKDAFNFVVDLASYPHLVCRLLSTESTIPQLLSRYFNAQCAWVYGYCVEGGFLVVCLA